MNRTAIWQAMSWKQGRWTNHEGKQYTLIDTAGVRRRARIDEAIEKFSVIKTLQAMAAANAGLLMKAVDAAFKAATSDLKTADLTRILEQAVIQHQPPMVHGRRIKLRYAHQGGRNPPLIVIHGNQTDAVPGTYQRYLVNRFRKAFKLWGTPVRIDFRTGDNPFKGRRNKLTDRQVRKRKRLIKFAKRK